MTLHALDHDAAVPDAHECPTPLERPADEFGTGGKFFSPAGRWELIRSVSYLSPHRLVVYTDLTGPDYGWQVWSTDKFAYIPSFLTVAARHVLVDSFGSHIMAQVTAGHRWSASAYLLIDAHQERGTGWVIADRVDGATVETVTVTSKAKARAEVNRRARAHAKRLGLKVEVAR